MRLNTANTIQDLLLIRRAGTDNIMDDNPLRFRWTRFLRLFLTALAFLLLAGFALTGWLANRYVRATLYPGCQGDRASLAEYGYPAEPVEFTSREGYTLRGWLTPGERNPGTVIVVLPGHGGNTRFALPDALVLAEAGFGTLIYEHRSCVDPALTASTGPHEAQDLMGAVDYLQSRADVQAIGVLGFSEGGTAVLLAAAQHPAIDAAVAEGGYSSMRNDILDPQADLGLYDRLMRRLVLTFMPLYDVLPRNASPIDVIDQIAPRPLLLVYGEYEAFHGEPLYAAAGEGAELWVVPGSGHGGYQLAAPGEYEDRIVTFFDAAWPDDE